MVWWQPARSWTRGNWSWQLRGDEVADVAFRGRLLLRSVRAVSRDRDWDTLPLLVEEVVPTASGVRLAVSVADDRSHHLLLRGSVTVTADAAGLDVVLDLRAAAPMWTNRTGLVVLHPPQLAGTALTVTHPDGSSHVSAFPRRISPHQPALDIRELSWGTGGLGITTRLEGDVFEMEDQRNWTDASFKTYSRPLSSPFPYHLDADERVVQRVSVHVEGVTGEEVVDGPQRAGAGRDERSHQAPDVIHLRASGRFPEIALGASTSPGPVPAGLDVIGDAVLVELDLGGPRWRAALDRARAGATPVDVRVVLDRQRDDVPEDLQELCRGLVDLEVVRVTAFDATTHVTDAATVTVLRGALRAAGISAPVLGGARSHFTELNREHASLPPDVDGIVFSITPLFHSTSTEQLVESVAVQRTVAEQAVTIAGGRPVHVGPVTLRPRFNNVATTGQRTEHLREPRAGPSTAADRQRTGAEDDRQGAPQLAAWTIASAAALALPGVQSLTYFEEWGPRGVRTDSGGDLPVAGALRALAGLNGSQRLVGASPDGLVWALGGSTPEGATVLAANLDTAPRRLVVETPHGPVATSLPPGSWSARDLPA